jgi:hypothetical protein
VLKANPESFGEATVLIGGSFLNNGSCSVSYPLRVIQYLVKRWPLVWDLTVSVTLLWILNIGINATLKDLLIVFRIGGLSTQSSSQVDI